MPSVKDKTKHLLAHSIQVLMESESLTKITVSAVVANCDVSRQTFYHHFRDKFDLVNWIFYNLFEETFHQIDETSTWEENIAAFLTAIRRQQSFYGNAYSCDSQNCLAQYEFELVYSFYRERMAQQTQRQPDGDSLFELELYCRGAVEMTAKWAREGMKQTPEELTRLFRQAMPEQIRQALAP